MWMHACVPSVFKVLLTDATANEQVHTVINLSIFFCTSISIQLFYEFVGFNEWESVQLFICRVGWIDLSHELL